MDETRFAVTLMSDSDELRSPIYSIWDEFNDLIPKVLFGINTLIKFHKALRTWHCFIITDNSATCGLAFFSQSDNSVSMFHPCIKPVYLRHAKQMIEECLPVVCWELGIEWVLTGVYINERVDNIVTDVGFELCGTIPVAIRNGTLIEQNMYKMKIRRPT